ncbi:MAG: hypothetical protein M0P71_07445 [Melioribacteraceae bacterium]|jgi:hypothetical protein|nr:hypothetical protein [Melioribacteraceae bacterium]MDD3982812.1 hypothetical protein [Candidatus Omnitrophota bacterium]
MKPKPIKQLKQELQKQIDLITTYINQRRWVSAIHDIKEMQDFLQGIIDDINFKMKDQITVAISKQPEENK